MEIGIIFMRELNFTYNGFMDLTIPQFYRLQLRLDGYASEIERERKRAENKAKNRMQSHGRRF